jgi:hypothetical protein
MSASPQADDDRSLFDCFAASAAGFASRGLFFTGCVLIVALWLPSVLVLADIDTWQLVVNTITTIITFLLVALLQNTQRRSETGLHQKLNAIADGLADLMERLRERRDRRSRGRPRGPAGRGWAGGARLGCEPTESKVMRLPRPWRGWRRCSVIMSELRARRGGG